jgi:hypothetical protein
VGFTATNSSFIIGQAFLTHEAEEDYIWVLQWIRELTKLADSTLLAASFGQKYLIFCVVDTLISTSKATVRTTG